MIRILKRLKKPELKDKDILIFDFDGTIADTMWHLIEISNSLADRFGYDKVELHEVEKMRDWTSQEVFKHLKVPILKIPHILALARKQLRAQLGEVKTFEGIKGVLLQLKDMGHEIGIFTSNSQENVEAILKINELNIFDFILTTPKLHNKNRGLKRIMRRKKFHKDNIIYVGDETRDIVAAKKAGVRVMAVAWGYNTIEKLSSFEPDFVCHEPEDIIRHCQS